MRKLDIECYINDMALIDDIKEDIDLLLENSAYESGPFITIGIQEIMPAEPMDVIYETVDDVKSSQQ